MNGEGIGAGSAREDVAEQGSGRAPRGAERVWLGDAIGWGGSPMGTQALPRRDEFRLCFVDGPWAYFANAAPTEMWGDDWNDAPHDCNAGTPYVREGQQVVRVAFDGDWTTVGQGAFGGYVKERWGWLCVERINRGEAPWMVQLNYGAMDTDPIRFEIHAGTTLGNFKLIVREAGGHVYEAPSERGHR